MVKKGNPLGIREFADIKNARYVNRQRGAGTRILCDYLLEKNGISPDGGRLPYGPPQLHETQG